MDTKTTQSGEVLRRTLINSIAHLMWAYRGSEWAVSEAFLIELKEAYRNSFGVELHPAAQFMLRSRYCHTSSEVHLIDAFEEAAAHPESFDPVMWWILN